MYLTVNVLEETAWLRPDMKIRSQLLKYMHLDRTYCLLTGGFYCKCSYYVCKRLCKPIYVRGSQHTLDSCDIPGFIRCMDIAILSTFPRGKIGSGKKVSINLRENMSCHSSILFAFHKDQNL